MQAQQLRQQQQHVQEAYMRDLQEIQVNISFPDEYLMPTFNESKKIVLSHVAPSSLNLNAESWSDLYSKVNGYNMAEMGALLSMMEKRSMEQMGMGFNDYVAFQSAIEIMAQKYADILQPEISKLRRKHEALSKIAQPNKTIALPR